MIISQQLTVGRDARRSIVIFFLGALLMNGAMAVASAVSTIIAADLWGTAWGALPATLGIIGTGLGALGLAELMSRRGRRGGLLLGYGCAAFGGTTAVLAVLGSSVPMLCAGMLLLGLGNAAAQLSRYAAAELFSNERQGFALGLLVWAGAGGGVGGPLLLLPTGSLAVAAGWPRDLGPYAFVLAACVLAVVVLAALPARRRHTVSSLSLPAGRPPLRALVATPTSQSALAMMVTAQLIMVAVMTATPVQLHQHGQGMGVIGTTLAAHTFGMFALSPLTGLLVDRVGVRAVGAGGLGTLLGATTLAALAHHQMVMQGFALFVLGYGWNLCFLAGSSLLAGHLAPADRARTEGAVDAVVWILAAGASLGSTILLALVGFEVLSGIAGALAVPAIVFVLVRRRMPCTEGLEPAPILDESRGLG